MNQTIIVKSICWWKSYKRNTNKMEVNRNIFPCNVTKIKTLNWLNGVWSRKNFFYEDSTAL